MAISTDRNGPISLTPVLRSRHMVDMLTNTTDHEMAVVNMSNAQRMGRDDVKHGQEQMHGEPPMKQTDGSNGQYSTSQIGTSHAEPEMLSAIVPDAATSN